MTGQGTIRISATLFNRPDGRTLLVCKRGTTVFMQAGGRIQPGEDAVTTLCRELHEEPGLAVLPHVPEYLGRFVSPAA